MLRLVTLPFCSVVMLDVWNAAPSRYFASYRSLGSYRWLLGHPVIDEFCTISSPIFLCPRTLLGKIYNAGLSLGHRRDPEMGIDQGWPPLCVGLDAPAPELPSDWESALLDAITAPPGSDADPELAEALRRRRVGPHEVECLRMAEATLLFTTAPMLPNQLWRLCEAASGRVVVAVALGNRLQHVPDSGLRSVNAVSEADLMALRDAVEEMVG